MQWPLPAGVTANPALAALPLAGTSTPLPGWHTRPPPTRWPARTLVSAAAAAAVQSGACRVPAVDLPLSSSPLMPILPPHPPTPRCSHRDADGAGHYSGYLPGGHVWLPPQHGLACHGHPAGLPGRVPRHLHLGRRQAQLVLPVGSTWPQTKLNGPWPCRGTCGRCQRRGGGWQRACGGAVGPPSGAIPLCSCLHSCCERTGCLVGQQIQYSSSRLCSRAQVLPWAPRPAPFCVTHFEPLGCRGRQRRQSLVAATTPLKVLVQAHTLSGQADVNTALGSRADAGAAATV